MKKLVCLALTLAMVLSLAACGGKPSAPAASVPVDAPKDSINVCIASEPDTVDPALNSSVDGATMISHLFAGIARWGRDPEGKAVLEPDCATELSEGVLNEDGTVTYTYTLRDGLKWSDGRELTAADFVYAWNRAASEELGADYGFLFACIKGYPNALAIEAPDAKTLVVTLNNPLAYWNELMAFPTFFPVREDVAAHEAWATDPSTYVSNGAYRMTGWIHNSVITMTKNEHYFDADSVTMEKINFYLSDDTNNMLSNYKNGDWQLIDDVPTNEMAALMADYPTEFHSDPQLSTYYVCWNVNEDILPADSNLTEAEAEAARSEIRNAIGLLLDRNYIVDSICQAGEKPASSFVPVGMTDADGTDFQSNSGHSQDYAGYYNVAGDEAVIEANFNAAVKTLKKYYAYDASTGTFTNFPAITYLYNTNDRHKAIAEYVSSALSGVGITMNMDNQEWNTFLNTRKNGDFTVAREGWTGDYNDPSTFLDCFLSTSGNNDAQLGKGPHADLKAYSIDLTDLGYDVKVDNGTWAETYDVICELARTCTDTETHYELLHRAEDLLMSTGTVLPLFYYTDSYLLDDAVQGFYANPLGCKFFKYCTIGG